MKERERGKRGTREYHLRTSKRALPPANSPPKKALMWFLLYFKIVRIVLTKTMNLDEQCSEISLAVISKVIYEKQMSPWRKSVAFGPENMSP